MKNLSEHQKGLLYVFTAALLWSSGGLFIKLISLSAMHLSFFRCLIAAITFVLIFRKRVLLINKLSIINSLFYAVVLITFVIATKATTAANAIFLQATAPIYVLIFEPLLNKTKYDRINIITVGVCIIGMILFFIGKLEPGHLEGNFIALLSGITFAALFLGMKQNDQQYQQSSIFWGNILVALICIPFLFTIKAITVTDLWMVTFLGVFQIAVAYAFFASGLKRILAVEASIISMVEPVFNPVWVFLGYGEVPTFTAIIGGLIILGAIVVRSLIAGTSNLKRKFNF
ncbi:MAG: DMT family transporter [Ignavibacteriaceae bacterium]|jgi:drug/metabolite transporter (DMT)-like permease|nr:DMT family transporter [Ignavibacteriaceae bacterium]MCU0414140.1 DMT family transporter [Ignavibacteriaceae bacterium]